MSAPIDVVASSFIHVGVVQISVANLIVILAMIVVFVLALVLPFPHGRSDEPKDDHDNG